MNIVKLYKRHKEFHSNLDNVNTPNLSKIKEISKRINFASISSEQQRLNNKGNLYHRKTDEVAGDYINNLTLDYTIKPRELGMIYGTVFVKTENDEEKTFFSADTFNNYARFITDLISEKVIYSSELEQFVEVNNNCYIPVNESYFVAKYPIKKGNTIDDFLEVMTELYRDYLGEKHDFKIYPYSFAGNDFVYHCRNLELIETKIEPNELFILKYDIDLNEIDRETPKEFINMVTDNNKSKHNLTLMHAYTVFRKMNLVQAEKWFLLKDFGRSGKGLFMTTFDKLLKVNKVNFDGLLAGGFDSRNEWLNFHDTDIAHANESGEINKNMMRILRKIATGEVVTGREIGGNTVRFRNNSVLILDTNEDVDIGDITANTTRTIKIALKDRPINETDDERYEIFEPYWEFVRPNFKPSTIASVSFLIVSLEYLKETGREFKFTDVTLKNYFSVEDLTDTQIAMLRAIKKQGFILAGDETLQQLIEEDYRSLKSNRAKNDIKKIGVAIGKQKKIEGINHKVHKIGNQELFDMAYSLLEVI